MQDADSVMIEKYRTVITPPVDNPAVFTVWIDRSCTTSAGIAERLRGLGIDVKCWDESRSAMPPGYSGFLASMPGVRGWRGGLAPKTLRRVREHVERCLAEKIELGELARIAGLSECHFARAFRQSLGAPPHRYIMTRRVAVAAGLLERTERSLTDIALAVGFSDQSHFTRTFVRLGGETPGAFRRRHR